MLRIVGRKVGVGSIVTIGAGAGADVEWLEKNFPGSRHLLIDADRQFEPGYIENAKVRPYVSHEICYVGAECRDVRIRKSGFVGGVVMGEEGDNARMLTLDALVERHRLPPPYFIRFDTNGAEPEILAGATKTLAHTSLVMMEVYNFPLNFMAGKTMTFDQMVAHMRDLGFGVVDMCDPLFRAFDGALWQFHLFFAPLSDKVFSHPGFRG